ncbi:MAG TPA: FAD-dependent monooxygenase [Kofleriaceae bacterium]|nr:FAD-dependent monooxygenase [Kofleriaceae bacterium]
MSRKNVREVLIAGAGPAGLGAALFLRERAIDVQVVDPGERPSDDELAVVLHRDVAQMLADAGVAFELEHEARAIESISIFDGARWVGEADLAGASPFRGVPIAVPRWLLCKKLELALRRRGGKVAWNHRLARVEVASDHVRAEIDALELDGAGYAYAVTEKIVARSSTRQPAYLVAADGRESVVRTQLGIPMHAIAAPEVTASFEVELDRDPGTGARIVTGDAIATIWPLVGRALRITFHLPIDALAFDLPSLARAHLPGAPLPIVRVRRQQIERRTPAIAERPSFGPAWLLGDAARTLSSAASQPVNQGLRDAHRLASALAQVLRIYDDSAPLAAYAIAIQRATRREVEHAPAYLAHVPARGPDLDEIVRQLGGRDGVRLKNAMNWAAQPPGNVGSSRP